jgi:hypothetical protein
MNEAKEALSVTPKKIIERAKEWRSDKWIMPGVRLV